MRHYHRRRHIRSLNSADIQINLTLSKGIRLSVYKHTETNKGKPKQVLSTLKRFIAQAEKQLSRLS